jgi:SAM-dependent methyltransferase
VGPNRFGGYDMTRRRSKWYVDFFRDGFYQRAWAPAERFQRAEREVDFIVEALGLPAGASVLDLCCGEGRHTVALARRGYRMTGLDLSALHLRLARQAAKEAGVSVRWHRADMRDIPWEGEFDTVINVFTSFGYFESDDEDFKVLAGAVRVLKPGGRFLLDTINREWLVRHLETHGWQEGADGTLSIEDRSFDLLTGRQRNRVLSIYPDGTRREREIDLRMYTLKELVDMLSRAGLVTRGTWGAFDGRDYGLDTRRMIVLAEKETYGDRT